MTIANLSRRGAAFTKRVALQNKQCRLQTTAAAPPPTNKVEKKVSRLSVVGPIDCNYTGHRLLNLPQFNKGSGFTDEERCTFGIQGMVPSAINSLQTQARRAYEQYKRCPTNLAKNAFLHSMRLQNQVLFFKLLTDHIEEMFSIIYTPTVGDSIIHYSNEFRRPEGCFLDITRIDEVETRLSGFGDEEDIDYIVVTDSEGILGIGDQGVGGIGICIGKLSLMTLCAGVHPSRVIPVVLDAGTNNESLLEDPLYLGNKFPRVRGKQYDEFVDTFIQSVKKLYPKAVVHFEDFGVLNGRRVLDRYKDELPCFNDDIEGTGAVTMAAITSGLKFMNQSLSDTRVLIYGAGSAGVGIADQIVMNMITNGMDKEEAYGRVSLIDRPGLLLTSMNDILSPGQRLYTVPDGDYLDIDTTNLKEIISKIKPNVLVGCSTKPGAFTEEAIKEMHRHTQRPIILPLSNPTKLAEAQPADILKWTKFQALVATGSPFQPVEGYRIAENNNCFVFPGIGLGAVLARASVITKPMLAAAVDALSELSPIFTNEKEGLLPHVTDILEISARVATAVVLQAVKDGVARVEDERTPNNERVQIPQHYSSCLRWVKSQMWKPEYRPLRRVVNDER